MAVQAQLYSGNSQDFQMELQPSNLPVQFPTAVSLHMGTQELELEQFINTQNERLRCAIQQDLQTSDLLTGYGGNEAAFLLAQKDKEIAMAASKTAELLEYVQRLEVESLAWRTMAWENQSIAESLNGVIQQMQMDYHSDEESYCSGCDEESGEDVGWCRWCEAREARVVLLPCRHLCLCGVCDGFLIVCPVCMTVKSDSIAVEAYV